MEPKKTIAITCGEPAGIGPEVALKALGLAGGGSERFVLVGPKLVWERAAKLSRFGGLGAFEIIEPPSSPAPLYEAGKMTKTSALCATLAVEEAARMALRGEADALVTAPLTKEGLKSSGRDFAGHTELLASICGVEDPTMAFFGGNFIVALATTHLPLRRVADAITVRTVLNAIENTASALKRHLAMENPHIGVCGLNPHAGEKGLLGREEIETVAPAVKKACESGINVTGPLPADAIFVKLKEGVFDAVVALYHDQGLGPFKLLHFHDGVNVTLGLPIVRTSPDHGTAFDIAPLGSADPRSMAEAVKLAVKMAGNVKGQDK